MNRNILIVLVGVVVVAAGGLVYWISTTKKPAATTTNQFPTAVPIGVDVPNNSVNENTQTEQAAGSAFLGDQLSKDMKVVDTAISGDYALVEWTNDPMGGDALLKLDQVSGRWYTVAITGGSFSVAGLVKEGVPARHAHALLNGLLRGE